MPDIAANLQNVISRCSLAAAKAGRSKKDARLVVVSKTHGADVVREALKAGHRVFGENRVQEAQGKWPELKKEYQDIELHLIGPLQSNKCADAVGLFDVIQTVDREKIALALSREMEKQKKFPKLLVQVNTGSEPQKAGIEPEKTAEFVELCREQYGLAIEGLMCIPPLDENPGPHFALLRKYAGQSGLKVLSMGMSDDFETAIEMGATHVRVGSAIFGVRE